MQAGTDRSAHYSISCVKTNYIAVYQPVTTQTATAVLSYATVFIAVSQRDG